MSKQSLLLVDGDTRSLRVLEVSLRKAGFMVTAATSGQDALGKLELHAPDLIISETAFPDGDGFDLRRRVRARPEWSEIPFIFLTAEAAIENKIRGLELGVDDYLTKPIYIREIVTRINILLQKRQRVQFEERRDGRTRFTGRVQDMPVVDVIQTIEISRKSGVIQFVGERGRQAAIYFRDGRVIDAEAGSLQGEDAVYRLLTWSEGEFEVVFRTVRRREVITMSSQGLLMEGMRRLDEWSRLFEQLPPLTHRFEVDTTELAARLGDVPDDNNQILRLFDGKRTLLEVIDASDVGDLECLQAISRLYFEELLIDLDHDKAPRRDTGRPLPTVGLDPRIDDDIALAPMESQVGAAAEDPEMSSGWEDAAAVAGRDEGDAAQDAGEAELGGEFDEPAGPLLGGYRPSSLRLIDEAVAAAQAIEPSLFEDGNAGSATGLFHRSNGVHAEAGGPGVHVDPAPPRSARPVTPAPPVMPRPAREEAGLRMIGSLGRDRAEASGELAPLGQARAQRSETARELVTILPRRATREMPAVTVEVSDALASSTPPESMVVQPTIAQAVELPDQAMPAVPRVTPAGSGVRSVSRSRRLLRRVRSADGSGPGVGALLLIFLAAVLAVTAVVLRLRRHARPGAHLDTTLAPARVSSPDLPAPIAAPKTADVPPGSPRTIAAMGTEEGPDDAVVAPRAPGSGAARTVEGAPGARVVPPAGSAGPREPGAGAGDTVAEAKTLFDKARDAFADGAFSRAFELAEASLRLRKTARTYLLRAQAAQRLDRIAEALASVDAAARLAPEFATVWELRGRILWAAQRRDEARAAFERFLALEPDDSKAASVRRLLNEPR